MLERLGDHLGDVWSAQVTSSRSLVKITFDLSLQVAMDFFHLDAGCICRNSSQGRSVFLFETKQHLPRQRIYKSESNKIGSALALHVRQVTTRMDAAAQFIEGIFRHS
jgi:hypothetical protein